MKMLTLFVIIPTCSTVEVDTLIFRVILWPIDAYPLLYMLIPFFLLFFLEKWHLHYFHEPLDTARTSQRQLIFHSLFSHPGQIPQSPSTEYLDGQEEINRGKELEEFA